MRMPPTFPSAAASWKTIDGHWRVSEMPRGHLWAAAGLCVSVCVLCVPVCSGIRSLDTLCPAGGNSQNADPRDSKKGCNGFPADLLTAKCRGQTWSLQLAMTGGSIEENSLNTWRRLNFGDPWSSTDTVLAPHGTFKSSVISFGALLQ